MGAGLEGERRPPRAGCTHLKRAIAVQFRSQWRVNDGVVSLVVPEHAASRRKKGRAVDEHVAVAALERGREGGG